MTPSDLVSAIVGNNPTAVHQNLMNMGVVDQQFIVTPQSFAELLSNLPHEIIPNKEQANNFAANALNVPVNNNGISAAELQTLINQYNLPMKDMVYQIFNNHLQETAGIAILGNSKSCGCGGACSGGMNGVQNTILLLALLGFLFVILLIVKLILKII